MSAAIPPNEFVADTMALVLRMRGRPLGRRAMRLFDAAERGEAVVHVPAMVLAEILYLSEKKRIRVGIADVADYMARYPACREHPLNMAVIRSSARITDIRELHDRLIAGTAACLGLAIVTNDPAMHASDQVKAIW